MTGIANVFLAPIDGLIGLINGVIDGINAIQVHIHVGPVGYDFNGLNLGHLPIPKLASGGIVTDPTVALIGEAGDEAVIPLGNGSNGLGTQVMSDRDIDTLLQKIGTQFVTNVLPSAGISISR